MADPFEEEDEEWVEIQDASGRRAAMRHLATVSVAGRTYLVLGALSEDEDGDTQQGLLLIRQDETVDGAQEYVVTSDEGEVENVIGNFIAHALMHVVEEIQAREEEDACPCGMHHRPGEFCVCGDEALLQ